ncbi:hypothetical protein [Palleronia caenipelagi]|uniref:Uncharacterized protein n=1 Tax=Palleronia caenipelagi TaxID=2489174 RepID=A0A547PJE5_9RHOB|nr:hypothetical protein [Palleronia caenipelagi]TRD14285.1 hypothetical protein FEV53_19235 [Palleronia caenipelagi]
MSAAGVLSEMIALGAKTSAASFRTRNGYDGLIRAGLIRESGVVSSLGCEECSLPHDAEIVFEAGLYGYHCPELGFVPVERSEVLAVQVNLPVLVEQFAELFGCKRRKTDPIHEATWRIGALETPQGDVTLYLHPRLIHDRDARALTDALSREARSAWRLIVTAEGTLSLSDVTTVALRDLIEIDAGTGALRAIAQPAVLCGVPELRRGGKPNRYRADVERLIRARIKSDEALPGRNEEAKAIRAAFETAHPGRSTPSLATVKAYLTKIRTG